MPVVMGKIKTTIFGVKRTECYKLALRLYTSYDFCHLRDKDSKMTETQTRQSSSYLIGYNPEASLFILFGLEGRKRRGLTEDEMVGWLYQFKGRVCANSGR